MAALRTEGCSRLFFGGRDVWTFAVLSAKRKVPFLFVPELSRNVVGRPDVKPFLEERGFTGDELFLDTGYAGSIPRALEKYWGKKFCFRLMSQSDVHVESQEGGLFDCDQASGKIRKYQATRWRRRPNQVFPNHNKARETAVETEYLAKYWKAGTYGSAIPVLVGQVAEVFNTWPKKENVRRVATKKSGWVALYDGKEIIEVSLADAKQLAPLLIAWMAALPEVDLALPEKVIQYFSDRRTIQRAALLTSMLWRGIPFWKAAMSRTSAEKAKGYLNNTIGPNVTTTVVGAGAGFTTTFNAQNYVWNGTNVTSNLITSGGGIGSNIQTAGAAMWPPTSSDLGSYMAQLVGQPLTPQLQEQITAIAVMMEKAKKALGVKPQPAQLPPAPFFDPQTFELISKDLMPIKPSPIILVDSELDDIDAGWELATV